MNLCIQTYEPPYTIQQQVVTVHVCSRGSQLIFLTTKTTLLGPQSACVHRIPIYNRKEPSWAPVKSNAVLCLQSVSPVNVYICKLNTGALLQQSQGCWIEGLSGCVTLKLPPELSSLRACMSESQLSAVSHTLFCVLQISGNPIKVMHRANDTITFCTLIITPP